MAIDTHGIPADGSTISRHTRLIFLGAALIATLQSIIVPVWAAPSNDTTPISFSIGHTQYKVPRNYMSQMTNYNGGPQAMVTFRVTYPGFEPLTEKTRTCLSSAAVYLAPGSGCVPLEFWIEGGPGAGYLEGELFQNLRKLFHSQIPRLGPNGFDVYETGPREALIRTYRKITEEHTLLINCLESAVQSDKAICESYNSPLSNGNKLSYRLDESRLGEAEVVDNGIRLLIRSFTVEGTEP